MDEGHVELEKTMLLKVLVGSRGYGIHDPDSDYDYAGVYVFRTQDLLKIVLRKEDRPKTTHWVEDKPGGEDETYYEIGHFMELALKCNPTVLNILKAPVVNNDGLFGEELPKLFPAFIDMHQLFNAFIGYGVSQRKKMVENKDNRWAKYGVAYTRQLFYLRQMLATRDYVFEIKDEGEKKVLTEIRNLRWSPGQILDYCRVLRVELEAEAHRQKLLTRPSTQDLNKVNMFLLNVRKAHW